MYQGAQVLSMLKSSKFLVGETVYIVPYIVVNLGKGFQQSTSQVAPTQTTNLQGEFSLPA